MFKRIIALACLMVLCLGCFIPAYAKEDEKGGTGSGSITAGTNGHISISGGKNGIIFSPGAYPNLAGVSAAAIQDQTTTAVINKTKTVAQTITAVCALICFVFFFINIVKLATSGSMSFQRRSAIVGLLWSGASLALFGGAWTVISFFWNFLAT